MRSYGVLWVIWVIRGHMGPYESYGVHIMGHIIWPIIWTPYYIPYFRGRSQTDFWKSHPIVILRILVAWVMPHDTGRFLENSSKIEHLVEKWYWKNYGAWNRPTYGKLIQIWMNFSEIGPAPAPETKISKKCWTSFPEIRLCHAPENWNFGKIFGWVFQDLPIRVIGTEICWGCGLTKLWWPGELIFELETAKTFTNSEFVIFIFGFWDLVRIPQLRIYRGLETMSMRHN